MAKELSPPKGLAMGKENLLMLKKLALVKVMPKQADDYFVNYYFVLRLYYYVNAEYCMMIISLG